MGLGGPTPTCSAAMSDVKSFCKGGTQRYTEIIHRPVLRIRDVYPGSQFFPSRIPDLGSAFFPFRIPDPQQKRIKYFNPKKIISKQSEMRSGLFIPDPYPEFLTIPDPGVKFKDKEK